MRSATTVPTINSRIICIVNRDNTLLAAVLSSYFSQPDQYFPLFTFPTIDKANRRETMMNDDDFIPVIVGSEKAVKINNSIARLTRIGRCEYIVLGGISPAQKSYFLSFGNIKIIEIDSIGDIADKLSTIGILKSGELRCKPSEIFVGLFLAKHNDKYLVIDESAIDLHIVPFKKDGLIVIEQDFESANTVVALNYAYSIDADVALVTALGNDEQRQTLNLLHTWRSGNDSAFSQVSKKVEQRVGELDFTEHKFATFFTIGLPYSLILENLIPFSGVDLSLDPDLFIVNCILAEDNEPFGSALVFCHDEFVANGEAGWLLKKLDRRNVIVRVLAGQDAVAHNFDYNAQHFPYDILHVVSHGGLMSGNFVRQNFTDRDGNAHIVEYDEVVSFQGRPDRKKICVQTLRFFRTLDGFIWRSTELASLNLPSYVFIDLNIAISDLKNRTQTATQTPKDDIQASRAIVCNDGFHQGTFHSLATYTSPIVFNNACWSWSDIASFFISSGARGYIGTYWDIENSVAVAGAKAFYEATTTMTVMEAVYNANLSISSTDDANIFMYWGLHFSTLSSGRSMSYNLNRILYATINELNMWIDHIPDVRNLETLTNTFDAIRLIRKDLRTNFKIENLLDLEQDIVNKLKFSICQLRARQRVTRDRS